MYLFSQKENTFLLFFGRIKSGRNNKIGFVKFCILPVFLLSIVGDSIIINQNLVIKK